MIIMTLNNDFVESVRLVQEKGGLVKILSYGGSIDPSMALAVANGVPVIGSVGSGYDKQPINDGLTTVQRKKILENLGDYSECMFHAISI